MSGQIITNQHGIPLHRGGRRRPIVTAESHPHLFRGAHLYQQKVVEEAPDFDYFEDCLAAQSDILGNADKGDCTAAGACHLTEVYTAGAGSPVVFSTADAIRFYSLSCGYVEGDPSTDQGGDEVAVCTYWRDHGLDGKGNHRILGWLVADPTKPAELKWLGYVFEGYYFGAELDKNWPDQVQGNGYLWSAGTPDPTEGHCFVGAKATGAGTSLKIGINSWGFLGDLTQPCAAEFCVPSAGGNIFIPFSAEIIDRAKQRAPNGFAYDDLLTDFKALGGGDALAADAPFGVGPGHVDRPTQVQVPAAVKIPAPPELPSDVGPDIEPPSSSPSIEASDTGDTSDVVDEGKGPSTQPTGAQPAGLPAPPKPEPKHLAWEALHVKAIEARMAAHGETREQAEDWSAPKLDAITEAATARQENGEDPRHTDAWVTGQLHKLVVDASAKE